jgi:hypothetical protein
MQPIKSLSEDEWKQALKVLEGEKETIIDCPICNGTGYAEMAYIQGPICPGCFGKGVIWVRG